MSDSQLAQCPLFIGCDLSQTTDPSACGLVWCLGDNQFYMRCHSWVCEEGVRKREESNLPKYREFEQAGVMTITPGTVNDYRKIHAFLLDLRRKFNVKEVIFDQFNAIEMATELMGEGFQVFRQPQNHKHYTSPMKSFQVAVNERRIKWDGNRLLRWTLCNCRMDYDAWGNIKPDRDKSTDKIDPAVAVLMAYGRAMILNAEKQKPSIYETRGIEVLRW